MSGRATGLRGGMCSAARLWGRARPYGLYLLRGMPRCCRPECRGPELRGAGSGSRAAGKAPRELPPSKGSRWSGRSR